jgi:microcystin-dependent protein
MAEPFLGEVKMMSFNFAPRGWAQCNGQVLPVPQNSALFSLLSNKFGGNGQTTFALPDLRGRTPIHAGNGHDIGEAGGEQTHTLALAELPSHFHAVAASSAATGGNANPTGRYLGGANNAYHEPTGGTLTQLQPGTVTTTGGGQAHPNMQPYLTINYCIALAGSMPPRS